MRLTRHENKCTQVSEVTALQCSVNENNNNNGNDSNNNNKDDECHFH